MLVVLTVVTITVVSNISVYGLVAITVLGTIIDTVVITWVSIVVTIITRVSVMVAVIARGGIVPIVTNVNSSTGNWVAILI